MRAIVIGPVISAVLLCANIIAARAETGGVTMKISTDQSLVRSAQTQPIAPNGNETAVPQQQPQPGSSTKPGSLSRELSKSGGVIHPPVSGDRGMVTSPPTHGAGRTPVIPPPGTPGGNPMVQPK